MGWRFALEAAPGASIRPDTKLLNRLGVAETVCLVAASLIAAIVLCGWLVPAFARALPRGWSMMKANTALSVLLCAASLVLVSRERRLHRVAAGRACAGVVVLLAGVALFEHWTGHGTGVGTLLAPDSGSPMPGRMSIQSASCFVLLAVSSVIGYTRRDVLGPAVDALNAGLALLILILLAGYLFGASGLVGQSRVIRTSPQTLVCVALLTLVATSRRAAFGPLSVLVGMGIGSQFARIALPASVVLSYLIISTGATLLSSGTLTLPYAAAVMASGMAAVMVLLVVLLARKINALDARLRDISITDDLTGVHNRRGFYLLGRQSLHDARRAAKPVTVLFFDVDGLKNVNDRWGHTVGSQLLLEFATLVRRTFRGGDVVGRIGGDEFAVISQGSSAELEPALRRLDDAVAAANDAVDKPYRISFSVGAMTTDPGAEESLEQLVDGADTSMYTKRRESRSAQNALNRRTDG